MIRRRLLFLAPLLLLVVLGFSWWWNLPRLVDMAHYVPNDSLLYLECNSLTAVVDSLTATEAWKELGAAAGVKPFVRTDRWLARLAWLGVGPAESVLLARAQVAVVMLDLETAEESTTLKIKPEGAVIIETHTSQWRGRPAVERLLSAFVEQIYGPVEPKRYREEADYLEWSSTTGDRRIVAALDQSLVILGNSKLAVQQCLKTRKGQTTSLFSDPKLKLMRQQVQADEALTFGYISSANAARLFSWGTPLLFGRGPGNINLEQIITKSAARLFGAIGWTSQAASGAIEDRFFFSLEPEIIARLEPGFEVGRTDAGVLINLLPAEFEAVTVYRFKRPAVAWGALRGITYQLDTLSAAVFSSVLKAALVPYGIEEPERFLSAVGHQLATVKLHPSADGTILIAKILDRSALEAMFKLQPPSPASMDTRSMVIGDKEFAFTFIDEHFLIGPPVDIGRWLEARKSGGVLKEATAHQFPADLVNSSPASIVTYANDSERVHGFFSVIKGLRGKHPPGEKPSTDQRKEFFATTETNLSDRGIERRTRSALGQFSTLLSLLRRD